MSRQTDWTGHLDVIDMVTELTLPHDHQEPYEVEQKTKAGTVVKTRHQHATRVAPLLHQLEHSVPSTMSDDRGGNGVAGFESRPAARLEVIDALEQVDHAAKVWLRRIDPGRVPPAETLVAVARVGGLMPRLTRCMRVTPMRRGREVACCTWHQVEADVRRWWTSARVVAGWDSPAWAPDASCPLCGATGTPLRIRFALRSGLCTQCHETWDPATIDLLGAHIREESFRRSRDRKVEPCWCPWPTPVDRMGPLCRTCGSARCHRAVSAGLEVAS